MKEVLGDVLADHLAFLEDRGIPVESWLGPSPIPERSAERIKDRRQRMDWEHFAPLCDSFWALLEPLGLNEAFADFLLAKPDGWAASFRSIFAMAVTPKLLVVAVMRISGISSFRCAKGTVHSLGPNELGVTMTINSGFTDCPAFFRYTGLMLERLPRVLGLPDAIVETALGPGTGNFFMKLPPHRVKPTRWLVGMFRYLQGARTIFRELAHRESELKRNYDELLKAQIDLVSAHKELEARVVERTQDFLKAKEEAEAASQAKTTFLANVSHELRTPLASILGFADVLHAQGHDEKQRQFAVEVITRNSRQLLSLVNDLLDIGRIESDGVQLTPAPVDPRKEVQDVVASLSTQANRRKVELSARVADDVPRQITTDGMRFRQILTNVVGNAIKYSDGGAVAVRVGMKDALVHVEVEDHGRGIDPSMHEQVFQPFFQANASPSRPDGGGAGLGLTIARRLTVLLGGQLVLVRSIPGKGSLFAFTIDPALGAS